MGSFRLIDIPVLGIWFRAWANLRLTNSTVMAEAKSRLLTDMEQAIRHGVPVDEALRLATMRGSDLTTSASPSFFSFPSSERLIRTVCVIALLFFCSPIWAMLFLASFVRDGEAAKRRLALRVAAHLDCGKSLSAAMAATGDFSSFELGIVRSGEASGSAAGAITVLGKSSREEAKLAPDSIRTFLPVIEGLFAFGTIAFIFITIIPKFEDIFMQIGVELPPLSAKLFSSTWLTLPAFLLFWIVIGRGAMRGGGVVSFLGALMLAYPVISITHFLIGMTAYGGFPAQLHMAAEVAALCIVLCILPWLVGLVEGIIRWSEYLAGAAFSMISSVARLRRQALWLHGIAECIELGMPLPEAVTVMSSSGGWRWNRAGTAARGLIEAGHPFGESCARCMPVTKALRQLLPTLDHGAPLPEALRRLASESEMGLIYARTIQRQVISLFIVLIGGAIIGVLVTAIYLPLFAIPAALLAQQQ